MSSIIIAGNTYSDVPSIVVPKVGGGTATYTEGGGASQIIEPIAVDYKPGFVNGNWTYENTTNNRTDVYEIVKGHAYCLCLGETVGSRFRSSTFSQNPVGSTSNITKVAQLTTTTNPSAYTSAGFKSTVDGYLAVTKDNASTDGIPTYLIDLTLLEQS